MTDSEVLAALDDRQTLGLTAWAEGRQIPRDDPHSHSPVEELIAVMVVVRNRLARVSASTTGASYKSVCLAPMQFSCWNPGSGSNHDALMVQARLLVGPPSGLLATDRELDECLCLADGVIAGVLLDRTGGATQYWAPEAMVPPGRTPSWAAGKPRLLIGDQYFMVA